MSDHDTKTEPKRKGILVGFWADSWWHAVILVSVFSVTFAVLYWAAEWALNKI